MNRKWRLLFNSFFVVAIYIFLGVVNNIWANCPAYKYIPDSSLNSANIEGPLSTGILSTGIHSKENVKKFADFLFCQNDFLRAIEEYQKYLLNVSDDTVRFKVALSLRMIGNYRKAESMFIGLSENSLLSEQAILEIFKTRFFSKDYSGLRHLFQNSTELPIKFSPEIKQLYYTSYLFDGESLLGSEPLPLEDDFLSAFPASEKPKMKEFFLRKRDPKYKSPFSAALLSTIIPGAGKIYTKEYGDAITAFIVTGLLGYLAVDNFHSKHDFRAGVFTGLGLFFYAGNIYGSAASAQIYNAGINYNFEHDLKVFLNANNFFSSHYESFCK